MLLVINFNIKWCSLNGTILFFFCNYTEWYSTYTDIWLSENKGEGKCLVILYSKNRQTIWIQFAPCLDRNQSNEIEHRNLEWVIEATIHLKSRKQSNATNWSKIRHYKSNTLKCCSLRNQRIIVLWYVFMEYTVLVVCHLNLGLLFWIIIIHTQFCLI